MDEKNGLREVFIWNLKLVKPMNLKLIAVLSIHYRIVQKVYDNSILVKIIVVHREDKENISDSNNQMIISKNMY